MKRKSALSFLIAITVLSFSLVPAGHAALPQGITQGEFALWLVKEAGAIRKIDVAGNAIDAIDFLRSIGVVPKEGWDPEKEVDDAFLRSFLDDKDASGTTDELLQKIEALVEANFNSANPSVFAVGQASGTTPA